MIVTFTAMIIDLQRYWTTGNTLLMLIAAAIFALSIWLAIEAYLRMRRDTSLPAEVPVEGD